MHMKTSQPAQQNRSNRFLTCADTKRFERFC